ncbi:MAG: ribonuclease Y [Peptostreptococcaceae bacterium]|nr:ribonuclease Y [Peptostreptococcaceae bacterium]
MYIIKIYYLIVVAVVLFPFSFALGYLYRKKIADEKIQSAEEKARKILSEANKQATTARKEALIDAKEEIHRLRKDMNKEIRERRIESQKTENRLNKREESLYTKTEVLEEKENNIIKKLNEIEIKNGEVDELFKKQIEELERVSGFTAEEAKEMLLKDIEKEVRYESAIMIKDIVSNAKEEAGKKAKEILAYSIQKYAADYVAESTVSVVNLPNDEMKGRIIGREGRNIRTLETLTGVDLIIDDTPEAVILSAFDPIKREIARIALEKLIVDGRIHPARIEEMVNKATEEIDEKIKEEGESATFDAGIHNLHPGLIKLLGRLKYRTSYGQNVLQHSIEVSSLAGLMAAELEVDVKLAKRAGLLHDIGKALDHDMEGTHVEIGMDVLKKYGESKEVIHAMSTHHGDYEPQTVEAILVTAADAVSAARPGARRETLETYVKRLEKLEEIAKSYDQVDKAFAIQAGREIRIMVKPEKISDTEMILLAREISKNVENDLEYPGQIKVNLIRETRTVDYAK